VGARAACVNTAPGVVKYAALSGLTRSDRRCAGCHPPDL